MKFRTLLVSFLTVLLMVSTASALPFNTTGGLPWNNTLHDTSAEYLINNGEPNYTVDVGDYLVGDLILHKINNNDIGNSIWPELTAHFLIEVATKTANTSMLGGYDYTFKSTVQTNEMAWFYTDPANDNSFANPASFSNGTLWASFGLTDSDTYWKAWTKTDNIFELAEILNGNPSANIMDVGFFNFNLDSIVNNTGGLVFKDVGTTGTELTGSGHFQAKDNDYSNQYHIGDQANMNINVVPEPTTLVLFGFGLLGVAGLSRRNRKEA